MSVMISSESCSRRTFPSAGNASFTRVNDGLGFPRHKFASVHEALRLKLCVRLGVLLKTYEMGWTAPA